jgi:hypothetical protein
MSINKLRMQMQRHGSMAVRRSVLVLALSSQQSAMAMAGPDEHVIRAQQRECDD